MATTKFQVTMKIEIEDVGDIPANASAVKSSIITAVEGISNEAIVGVRSIGVIKTDAIGIKPKTKQRKIQTKQFKAEQARRSLREQS